MKGEIVQIPGVELLRTLFLEQKDICFSFLFGSRSRNSAGENSDWDIAIWFKDNSDQFLNLGRREEIRAAISRILCVPMELVDIVDLYRANLSIASTVVEEGIPLSGNDTLEMARYYQRIWALVEDNYSRAAFI